LRRRLIGAFVHFAPIGSGDASSEHTDRAHERIDAARLLRPAAESSSPPVSIPGRVVRRLDEARVRRPGDNAKETTMRVMVIVKATPESEAGVLPSEELLTAMGRYNEELVKAGVLLAGEGLHPSSKGVRVRFSGSATRVVDGPFTEVKELVAGFWLLQMSSMEEAVEWARRCPNPAGGESELEIRPVLEADDLGEALTPGLREQEERLRNEVARQQ
jgi:hypothetical protein